MRLFEELCHKKAYSSGICPEGALDEHLELVKTVLFAMFGILSEHKITRFRKEDAHNYTVIVMHKDQQQMLKGMGIDALTYNGILGQSGDVEDVEGIYQNPAPAQRAAHVMAVAHYFSRTMKLFCRKLSDFQA